jgi:N-acylneuraminate cytidylyltransferase
MVSTDDENIAGVARNHGASVPFMRSSATAGDHAVLADVVREVLEKYSQMGRQFDGVCCILGTAFFLRPEMLKDAHSVLCSGNGDGVMPVVKFGFPIQRALSIDKEGRVAFMHPEYSLTRSQDLPEAFHDCGQFYFLKTEAFIQEKKMYTDLTIPYNMPESEVQDIDNEEDWKIAEIKYTFLKEKIKK